MIPGIVNKCLKKSLFFFFNGERVIRAVFFNVRLEVHLDKNYLRNSVNRQIPEPYSIPAESQTLCGTWEFWFLSTAPDDFNALI